VNQYLNVNLNFNILSGCPDSNRNILSTTDCQPACPDYFGEPVEGGLLKEIQMKYYYVYILKCNDDSYYTGVTNDIEKRIREHNGDHAVTSYTYNRRPVQLVYSQQFNDIKQAIELEKQIKGWSRKKKEALINEDWEKLKLYSKNYTDLKKNSSNKL